MTAYPKRLIEVDLPIKRISEHARREKSIRHGHISTLHIWWARRPLAACRAVICAALWPDPADPLCPPAFRQAAATHLVHFAGEMWKNDRYHASASPYALGQWQALARPDVQLEPANTDHQSVLRGGLLNFIADFANWDNATNSLYLETARALTQAAHEALGGAPGTRPLVVDPFAGGGAIPLEALRVGADAFASDLNPVAVLLNKVVLEYIPRYGQRLADEVRKWGQWIKEQAEKELAEFYPQDPDGATPIAYLWARTITCEGPGCGAEVPLLRSQWLAKRAKGAVALHLLPDPQRKRVEFDIIRQDKDDWISQSNPESRIQNPKFDGTVKRGSATCPVCGYTTPVTSVRKQLKARRGGAADARLFCVITTSPGEQGRFFRLPNKSDSEAVRTATEEIERQKRAHIGKLSLVPDESTEHYHTFSNRGPLYGMLRWEDYFTPRQNLALATLARLVQEAGNKIGMQYDAGMAVAVSTSLALALDKQVDSNSSLCSWRSASQDIGHTFGRQALPMLWDFVEANILSGSTRDWLNAVEGVLKALQSLDKEIHEGHVQQANAIALPLPNDSADAVVTDPPYYYSVQYADLSDFFYVWLRRTLMSTHAELFGAPLAPKNDEIIVQSPSHEFASDGKNRAFYESRMQLALSEGRRILTPVGIGVVVFAHTSTAGWESQLRAMVGAGWTITGSWPIDTEMASRVIAKNRAVLASSIHLVCRPREDPDGSPKANVGNWRDVLQELPGRIHAWLPRLDQEGVVGADALFACLGPALEIFSRYSRVERASGEEVTLPEYLEHVWAAVSREALQTILDDGSAADFEEDARLTVIWFWVLKASPGGNGQAEASSAEEGDESNDDEEKPVKSKPAAGYTMEYDAARKLAQGLGVDLHRLSRPGGIIVIKGNIATLNNVASREPSLIGQQLALFDGDFSPPARSRKGQPKPAEVRMRPTEARQTTLFAEEVPVTVPFNPDQLTLFPRPSQEPRPLLDRLVSGGHTVLDRLHQAMLLFAGSRSEILRRFLVDDGVGQEQRFWRLADALSRLYPAGSDEKRWVDGVLARKKGLGF